MRLKKGGKLPYDYAVEWVKEKYKYTDEEIKKAQEFYFGHSIKVIREVSSFQDDWDDAVAWDIHEIIESIHAYRAGFKPNFRDRNLYEQKQPYHLKAVEAEIKYLISKNRRDLIDKLYKNTLELKKLSIDKMLERSGLPAEKMKVV